MTNRREHQGHVVRSPYITNNRAGVTIGTVQTFCLSSASVIFPAWSSQEKGEKYYIY